MAKIKATTRCGEGEFQFVQNFLWMEVKAKKKYMWYATTKAVA